MFDILNLDYINTQKLFGASDIYLDVYKTLLFNFILTVVVFQNRPYYLEPSLSTGSMITCQPDVPCYIFFFFTVGDKFGHYGDWFVYNFNTCM